MSNWKFFIARRIYRSREGEKEVSKPAVRIAMAGIAIGLAVMIVSVAVVIGFKHQVRDKVIGMGSDIVVSSIEVHSTLAKWLRCYFFTTKGGAKCHIN